MILELLAIYASIILGCIISTTCLIFLGKGWGPLPHYYLRLIAWMQDFFEKVYPESDEAPWPAIIKKTPNSYLSRASSSSSAQFKFLLQPRDHLEISIDAIQSGIEAIVQDNVSSIFHPTPSYSETLLRTSPLPHWSTAQKAVFYVSLFFRYGILFPTRLCLLLISFVFLACAGVFAVNKKLSDREKTWVGIVYCRLYCCAMGVVATYKNTHLRPKGSGVAVSNHLTPSDVQVLFAGTPHGSQHGFVVTGQKHSGIIGSLETLAGKVAPTYWVERKNADGRKEFLAEIVKKSKFGAPVLLFPEGYCANNTQVLQFRKAIFQDGVKIYPMAVKHDSRFGDAFWYENDFHSYVLRIMTSWATPYDVTYLAPMTRLPHETDTEFAARTQFAISDVVGVPASDFNGSMWYSKSEQRRVLEQQKAMCATALLSHLKDTAEKIDSEDGYFSLTTSASSSHCSSPTAISSMHY